MFVYIYWLYIDTNVLHVISILISNVLLRSVVSCLKIKSHWI
ncbi:hypothetical protein Goshw_005133 [Gossypium schwendimanii]|uniref:Uncharacterized protein n=1 Tax=Gossypium schwendimanii TaxID=34291 RepID=A0A7J9LKJ2_GOSSC|nr:hypothetical protein [Gossypium schwendimanii]